MNPSWLSGGSNNGNIYACSGSWNSGNYCLGPQDVQCCTPAAAPPPPPPPPPPTNVTANCSASGTIVTVTWTPVAGYSYYFARIHDATTNTQASYSQPMTGSSYAYNNATPGHRYSYWVHTTNAAGSPFSAAVPAAYSTTVTCPVPTRFDQSSTTPGIIFTGNEATNFGLQGQNAASTRGWVVGGLTYAEVYPTATNTSSTAYQYIMDRATSAQITINPIPSAATCASLSNCTLPAGLARGVYRVNGDLILNAFTVPPNTNYVFLVSRDVTIRGNISVPNSSTVLFSAGRDIIIPATVGAATNTFPLPTGQIQGIYSANRNFTIQGINNCITGPDRMLNIEGALVVNAGGTGGSVVNQRDLCGFNPTIPSFTIRGRVDLLLNLPEFLMKRATVFREDSP